MDQRKVNDDKLVHVGVTILQESKLLFLKFVDFLRQYLVPGSYETVYCGKPIKQLYSPSNSFILDTDSLCLSTTKTGFIQLNDQGLPQSRKQEMESVFFPIVKNGMLEKFKSEWTKWFVLSNKIEDEKRPGLLKPEFQTSNGEIVALCPKNYQIYCFNNSMSKMYIVFLF